MRIRIEAILGGATVAVGGTGVYVAVGGIGVCVAVGGIGVGVGETDVGVAVDTGVALAHPASNNTISVKPNVCCNSFLPVIALLLSSLKASVLSVFAVVSPTYNHGLAIVVGLQVTQQPPHGSLHAGLPHRVLQ
jgi:hypothetical protein